MNMRLTIVSLVSRGVSLCCFSVIGQCAATEPFFRVSSLMLNTTFSLLGAGVAAMQNLGLERRREQNKVRTKMLITHNQNFARHTRPEGHFVWATVTFVQRPLPPTPRAETGLPLLQSIQICRLVYHQSEAWPVEQKALPPQFYSKCHDRDSNPHSADQTPELNRS